MSRILVHIEKIHTIEPIEGADVIELVKLLDWQCVAKKGEFAIGDLAVYHEIDSVCPEKPHYEFLRDKKFRVKTIKLKGQLSQGLALPLSILPKGKYKEGQDVTDITGVIHYDPEHTTNVVKYKSPKNKFLKWLLSFKLMRSILLPFIIKKGGEKLAWPSFISHTDEENIQAIFSKVKRDHGDKLFYVTEKIDYQSATFFTRTDKGKKTFGVLSRTQWKNTPDDSLWWQNAIKFDLEKKFKSESFDVTVQGESGDTKVQGNKYGIKESDLWVFTVIDSGANRHFNLEEMESFCAKHGLKTAPVLDRAFKLPETVLELIEYSKGKSVLNGKVDREGVVIRLIEDGKKVVSFKVKNPDFLIKHKE